MTANSKPFRGIVSWVALGILVVLWVYAYVFMLHSLITLGIVLTVIYLGIISISGFRSSRQRTSKNTKEGQTNLNSDS
jgi:hypothetical protein